jgi:hypothetical protein
VTVKTRLFRARLRLRRSIERRLRGGFDAIFPSARRAAPPWRIASSPASGWGAPGRDWDILVGSDVGG